MNRQGITLSVLTDLGDNICNLKLSPVEVEGASGFHLSASSAIPKEDILLLLNMFLAVVSESQNKPSVQTQVPESPN